MDACKPQETRNYTLFGYLAKVRRSYNSSLEPRGVPKDISENLEREVDSWFGDGHNHSWLTLEEALPIYEDHCGWPWDFNVEDYFKDPDKPSPEEIALWELELITNTGDSLGKSTLVKLKIIVWFFGLITR